MSSWSLFHFLRPEWLLALPLCLFGWWRIRRSVLRVMQVGELVAPHLRDALTVHRDSLSRLRPVDGVAGVALCLALAAAGPTWSRQPSPWFAETAPLVVAMEVSDSMRANDLAPTRLDRARFKVLDLVAARTGTRTAVMAYAGSAHIVVPPSTDIEVIRPLLESLDPAIMPAPGANASAVLEPALALLGEDAPLGTLLFINDGFDALDIPALSDFVSRPGTPAVTALVVGSDRGGVALMPDGSPARSKDGGRIDTSIDTAVLRRVENEAGIRVTRVTSDDEDLRRVLRTIASQLAQADDPDARWRDEGWWFLWPAALLTLLSFRRGWTMRW
ncbi:MAG: VWA domain-containing protein [Pseudomonadota bacterium]